MDSIGKNSNDKNLIFEQPNENDFKRFFEINSAPENNLYNPNGPMDYDSAKTVYANTLKHWKVNNFGPWKISEIENPDFVIGFGGISYRKYGDETKLNLGYRIDKNYWGKGYATQLAKNAINYAFINLNFDEVYALVRPRNIASIKVLEKCKMKLFDTLADVPNEEKSLVFKIRKG